VLRSSRKSTSVHVALQVLNKEELSQQDRIGHISDLNKRLQARLCTPTTYAAGQFIVWSIQLRC